METMEKIIDTLLARLQTISFDIPVKYVYNPLEYAGVSYLRYWQRYGGGKKEVVLLGMNPGPWGMVQTGIPFGDVGMVKGWLGLEGTVRSPRKQHPKRPIAGFQCARGEISGQRLWGWARDRFVEPSRFFRRFWVANYCPLAFMEAGGRNRTPDKLAKDEKKALFAACDEALVRTVELLKPRFVVGIGNFAHQRAVSALSVIDVRIGRITHPSPANPKANRGWAGLIEKELSELGIFSKQMET
jgi:single-strand selective monofunctional uracil DNA glycosylase